MFVNTCKQLARNTNFKTFVLPINPQISRYYQTQSRTFVILRSIFATQRPFHQSLSGNISKKSVGLVYFSKASSRSDSRLSAAKFSSYRAFWKEMGEMQSQQASGLANNGNSEERPGKIVLTDTQWKAKLTPEQYSVCRKHGTERPWTGDLLDNKQKGTYTCACCGADMFSSSTKYDSGSGWPSFFDALKDKDKPELSAVDTSVDRTLMATRTEIHCGKCEAHLGHVFDDGPRPTGLRYCINSVCLKFKPEGAGGNGPTL